ncbi:MAG: outer membrane protein assembly factor BamA [Nitrospinae bacterium]|nr:outer membrane protein assembly factor BamA [Nitrospinota bacterium]
MKPLPFRFSSIALGLILLLSALAPGRAFASPDTRVIKDIRIKGLVRADRNTVRYYIQAKTGAKYDPASSAEDIRKLFALGYFDDIQLDLKEEQGGVALTYVFKEKPFVRDILISGTKEVEEKILRARIKTQKGTFFRQDQIPWDKTRIKQTYRNKGFYFSDTRVVVKKLKDNYVDVEFIIDEGQKITVGGVYFRGVSAFPERTLKGQIETEPASWYSVLTETGAYKKDALKTDLLRMESFYHDNGYIKVRVFDPEVEVDKEKRRIYVVFPISEGDQYRVGSIEIAGDDVYSEDELREKIKLKPGDVFNRSQFRQDIFDITDLYSQKGYAYANVIPAVETHEDTKTVDVKITTNKGRKVYVGRINITGNESTRDRVIRREFRLSEGELFNSEKLRRSKQRINNLGFFDTVEIEQRSRKEEDLIDIETKVAERSTGQLSFAVGYSSLENLIIQGQVKWGNLLGMGQELSLSVDTSSRRSDFTISFTEPSIMDREISGGFDVYNKSYTYDAYESRSTGGSIRTGKALSEYVYARLGYRYEKNEVTIIDRDTASSYLLEQEGTSDSGSVFPSITYDTRNDPFSPTAGQKIYGSVEVAGLGGDQRYYRLVGEYTYYQSMFLDFVGMVHGRIGRADGYEGKGLPITQRFFLGGPTTLRGFTIRDIGPKDEKGEAIGGQALLQLNLELQYRFTRYFRGFLFYDRGNVYGTDDVQNNTTDKLYDLEQMRHSWGFGVHFFSPMGPISVAYGFKLDQRTGESPNEFHFTIGGAF